MRKTYKVHLRNGTTLKIKGDDFTVRRQGDEITGWEVPNVKRWVWFMPQDIIAVERVK